jgi:hypothetical protein
MDGGMRRTFRSLLHKSTPRISARQTLAEAQESRASGCTPLNLVVACRKLITQAGAVTG